MRVAQKIVVYVRVCVCCDSKSCPPYGGVVNVLRGVRIVYMFAVCRVYMQCT